MNLSVDKVGKRFLNTWIFKDISLSLSGNNTYALVGHNGSGKSTLAFDTIYAEGQRKYIESLSAYARQFLDMMDKPKVDKIEGL